MPTNQVVQIDTIPVVNYCDLGQLCPNHVHGIVDTTYYFYANVGHESSFRKLLPSETDYDVNCTNLYKDVFGNVFYLSDTTSTKQIQNVMQAPKLNAFDTIEVGSKVFPAATSFVPHYFTHSEVAVNTDNNSDSMVYDITSFTVLVFITVAYFARAWKLGTWAKLKNDVWFA